MEELKGGNPRLVERLRLALLVCGVDTNPRLGGLTSAAHSAADIDETIAAWREAIHLLRAENELPA
jgi:glutamate-1-semialdehyde aminotransferase